MIKLSLLQWQAQTDRRRDIEELIKWSNISAIARTIIWIFGIGGNLLIILREFTNLVEKAPFLYSKIFVGILLAIFLAVLAIDIFCYVKTRKYKKPIEEIENEEIGDETNESETKGL